MLLNTFQKSFYEYTSIFKYIIKNFNPKYPQVIPEKLIFATKIDFDITTLESCSRFIKNKMKELMDVADFEFDNRNIIKKPKEKKIIDKKKTFFTSKEYKDFTKECKKQLLNAMNLLEKGTEEFNKAFEEMHNRILDFYLANKPQKK